jgi:CubicO group peptidase (beta-lactamase class C family)
MFFFSLSFCSTLFAEKNAAENSYEIINEKIESLFNKSDIPGLSFILVDEKNTYIKNWGYADIENKIPVTSQTLFELGSSSKAFTALAILQMEEDGMLNLEDEVSKFIPWFKVFYEGKEVQIKISNLLHHTSGIPMETISKIPQGDNDDMLEKTVGVINDLELKRMPGEKYEYSSINYDILGLLIERISHLSFQEYLQKNIFNSLDL